MTAEGLDRRSALPEGLRALLREMPREGWERHPNFPGLVQFWMERHVMFRRMTARLQADAEAMLEGQMEGRQFAANLSRLGGHLVQQLHGHHQIEDHHYFPILQELEPRLLRGFEILDRDHHALDDLLAGFTAQANDVLAPFAPGRGPVQAEALRDAAGAFRGGLAEFARQLERHLADEEELIVPVILRHGPDRLGG